MNDRERPPSGGGRPPRSRLDGSGAAGFGRPRSRLSAMTTIEEHAAMGPLPPPPPGRKTGGMAGRGGGGSGRLGGSIAAGADGNFSTADLVDDLKDEELSPLGWEEAFDERMDVDVNSVQGSFRCYSAGNYRKCTSAMVFFHGGGHSALSWSAVVRALKAEHVTDNVFLLAYDARGHGMTTVVPETDLSAERMVADAFLVIEKTCLRPNTDLEKIIVVGHSMGGAIATRVVAKGSNLPLYGVVAIDVVEGTALSALPHMQRLLHERPQSFKSPEQAVRYVLKSGAVRNVDSARRSIAAQIRFDKAGGAYVWRTKLEDSEPYWRGWFLDLSKLFITAPVLKLLVLAGVDRLDKTLTIAHMQGKFQNVVVPSAGHAVHEDEPTELARVLVEFLQRSHLV